MVTKTLTIKKSVYDDLSRIKKDSESFSDLFERLTEKEKPNLLKYAGLLTKKEAEGIEQEMSATRKRFNKDFSKRQKEMQKIKG